jgi:hypothetical protein
MKKQLLSIVLSGFLLVGQNMVHATELTLSNDGNTSSDSKTLLKGSGGDNGIKGKILVSAGVGFNATRTALLLNYSAHEGDVKGTPVINSSSQIPLINVGVDYGLARRFSAGIALGYQSIKLNANAISNGIAGTDTWTRIHMAVRGDYHIVATDNVSLYTGLKFGYNMYSLKSTYSSVDPTYVADVKPIGKPLTTGVQAHMGFSYFFNGMVGFNTEVGLAIGGPYYFAVGIGFKL